MSRPTSSPVAALSMAQVFRRLAVSGECRFDPELHTGPDSFGPESPAERLARTDAAREVCEACPVWDLCLDYALRLPAVPQGVWAGFTHHELAALKRHARTAGEVA